MKDNSLRTMLICLLILGAFLGAYEGIWRQGAKKVVNIKNTEDVYLEVIWDASGSMWGRELGVEKIVLSREVLEAITYDMPENINMGLRIFGARKIGDMNDSFLAVPFTENNHEEVINFMANVKPLGKSPIIYSLKEAVKDLEPMKGKKAVLLVSDCIANTDFSTQDVITMFNENNISLHIVHVGDLKNQELKTYLTTLARECGGNYYTYNEHQKIIPALAQ